MADRTNNRVGLASAVLGGIAAVLAVITAVQAGSNRDLQDAAAAGQAQVQKAQTLAAINNNVVQLLAKTAAENNDADLRVLLAKNGVTFQTRTPDPAAN